MSILKMLVFKGPLFHGAEGRQTAVVTTLLPCTSGFILKNQVRCFGAEGTCLCRIPPEPKNKLRTGIFPQVQLDEHGNDFDQEST